MRFESSPLTEDESIDINVIPLIDVLLVLLIFFILSTTFDQSQGISVKLPKAQAGTAEASDKNLSLSIDTANNIFLDGRKISLESIENELRTQANNQQIKSLIIRADEKVTHGYVVRVMDEAKRAGVEKLSLSTIFP